MAGSASMMPQNWQMSSDPMVASARSTTARAVVGSGAAVIIEP